MPKQHLERSQWQNQQQQWGNRGTLLPPQTRDVRVKRGPCRRSPMVRSFLTGCHYARGGALESLLCEKFRVSDECLSGRPFVLKDNEDPLLTGSHSCATGSGFLGRVPDIEPFPHLRVREGEVSAGAI